MNTTSRMEYESPLIEYGEYVSALICASRTEGSSEDLTEENWTF